MMTKKKLIIIISAILAVVAIVAGVIFLAQGIGSSSKTVEVEFNLNYEGAGAGPKSIKVKQGDTYGKLPDVAEGTRPGYDFAGWYLSAAYAGNPVDENTTVRKSINHKLYAKWVGKEYTVSFDLQGGNIHGETTASDATVTCGKVYGVLAIPEAPQRDGYRFAGWYYDAEGTSGEVNGATKVIKAEDHTLYAKWVAIIYNYTFDDPKHAEDFSTSESRVSWEVVDVNGDNKLKFTCPSENQESKFIALNGELKAGTRVSMDVTFEGSMPDAKDRMYVFCYGLTEAKGPITAGKYDPSVSSYVASWYNGNGIRARAIDGDIYLGDEGSGYNYKGDTTRISFTVMEDCYGICIRLLFGVPSHQSAIYLDNIKFTPYEGEEEFNPVGNTATDATAFGYNVGTSCFDLTEVELDGAKVLKVTNNGNGRRNFLWYPKELKAGTQAKLTVTFEGELFGNQQMYVFCYGAKENGDHIGDGSLDKAIPANANWYNGQGLRAKVVDGEFYVGDDGTGYKKGNTVTIVANIQENCHGLLLWMLIPDGCSIYIHDLQFGTGFGPATGTAPSTIRTLGNYKYDSQGFNFKSTELNGEKVIKITKANATNNSMPQYWTKLKAGDRVQIDVSFESTLGSSTEMHAFFYQMSAAGANIGEYCTGTRAKVINGELKTGDGDISNYTGKARRTFELTILEDCSGIVMLLNVPKGTTIYIHDIKVVNDDEGAEEVDPLLKDYVFNNSSYNFEVTKLGEEDVIKITKGEIERNGLPQYWKDLKAGQTVRMKVTYALPGFSGTTAEPQSWLFFYQMDANGANIGEYAFGRRACLVDGVVKTGDGWTYSPTNYSGDATVTLEMPIQQDCFGLVMLVYAPEGAEIYIHSIEVVSEGEGEGTEEDSLLKDFVFDNSSYNFVEAKLGEEDVIKVTKGEIERNGLPQYWKDLKAGQTVRMKVTYALPGFSGTTAEPQSWLFFYQMNAEGANIGEHCAGIRACLVDGVVKTGDGWSYSPTNYSGDATVTLEMPVQQDCFGLVMLVYAPEGAEIYIHSIEVVEPAEEDDSLLDNFVFTNSGCKAEIAEFNGEQVIRITSDGTTGSTMPKYWTNLKAGQTVKLKVSFELPGFSGTTAEPKSWLFAYQMDANGNNIGEYNAGIRACLVDGVVKTGDGWTYSPTNYAGPQTVTLELPIQQDCSGLVFLTCAPEGTVIYIHGIEIV